MEANSGDITIRFRVTAPEKSNLFVTGDIIELGKGRLDRALKLTPATDGAFEGSIKLTMTKKSEMVIKYKYISHLNLCYQQEQLDRTLLVMPGRKLIQIIDEYNEYNSGMPEPWLIQIEKLVGRSEEKKKQLGKPPKDAIQVQFVVKATVPHPSCRVLIFGNNNFLGNWDPLRGKTMQYTALKWELDCFVAPSKFPLEYKYAIIDANERVLHENEGPTRKILLQDLDKEHTKGTNVSVKINDLFRQEDQSGTTFPFEEYYHRFHTLPQTRSNFQEFLTWDARTGKLIASNNFYGQLAMECGKDCAINMKIFTTHDFPGTDLVHEQLCKSLLDPQTKVRSIVLCARYFANISPKRIAMMNHVFETSTKLTKLILEFNSCCSQEKSSETRFIYEGLSSGKFKFITSVVFSECEMSDPLPVIEIMKNNKTLKEITFFGCAEERAGSLLEHVIDQLFMNKTITSVSLQQNISKKGMESLQKLLTSDKTLTELSIGQLDSDLTPFSESLKLNTTLKRLQVSGFRFPNKEVVRLLQALKSNETLQQFSLKINDSQHKFSDEELSSAIHELFTTNTTLTKMEISVVADIVHEPLIREYTSRNKTIQRTYHNDLIVTLFNIARHHARQSLQIFPHDVWLHIFKYIPGRNYDKILNRLFDNWTIRQVV